MTSPYGSRASSSAWATSSRRRGCTARPTGTRGDMSNPRPDAAPGGLPGPTRTRGVLHTGATGIFRRKPIPLHEPDQDQQLKRSLGLWSLTAIGLGAIIGAGMFTL